MNKIKFLKSSFVLFVISAVLGLIACSESVEPEPELSAEELNTSFTECSKSVTDIDWAFANSRVQELRCFNAAEDSVETLAWQFNESTDQLDMIAITQDGFLVDYVTDIPESTNQGVYSTELTNNEAQALMICARRTVGEQIIYSADIGTYCPAVGNEYALIR